MRVYANTLDNQSAIHANGFDALADNAVGYGSKGVLKSYTVAFVNRDMAGGGGGGGGGGAGGDGGTVLVVYGNLVTAGSIYAVGGGGSTAYGPGAGINTNLLAGINQSEENGKAGGAPNGGAGGRSETGNGNSNQGGNGGNGANGAPGSVTFGPCLTCYTDADGDGFGAGSGIDTVVPQDSVCESVGLSSNNLDCDDSDPNVSPDGSESSSLCDGIDNDCDGLVDYGALGASRHFLDSDSYGFGTGDSVAWFCDSPPAMYAFVDGDCDDSDASVNPDASELCDGIDNNCNDLVDDGIYVTYYHDSDGDGYGNPAFSDSTCSGQPAGWVTDNTDCDDSRNDVNPAASEVCGNGLDDDCNGLIDTADTSCCCDTAGDADNSGSITIGDVTFLIARIFGGGPAPACQDEADSDGSNSITIGDATYLIARIFSGGPAPICGTTGT